MAGRYDSTFRSHATDQVVVVAAVVVADMTAADAASSPEGEDGEAIAVGVVDEEETAADEVAGEVAMHAVEALPRSRAGKPHFDVHRLLLL